MPSSTSHEFATALKEFIKKIKETKSSTRELANSIDKNQLATENGISLLELKLHNLLGYITNLSFYLLLKVNGYKIEAHPVIDQLIKLRVVLEKCQPLELKLKYQIDKLIKAANANFSKNNSVIGQAPEAEMEDEEDDPLQFKPNLANLETEESASKKKEQSKKSSSHDNESGVYKPPRLAPMHYNPESNKKNPTKLSDRAREIANNSRILNELRDEYDDRPEEESALGMGYGGKMKGNDMDDRLEQRIKFEEDNFIRKTMSKQDKKLLNTVNKRGGVLRFQNEFQDLDTDFQKIGGVQRAVEADELETLGTGVMRKRNITNEKRKREGRDTGDMLSQASKDVEGGGEFRKKMKIMKRAATLKSRKKS